MSHPHILPRVGLRARIPIFVALSIAMLMVVAVEPIASADTKSQLEQARARLAQIDREVQAQQAIVDRISTQTAAMATRVTTAEARVEKSRAELDATKRQIATANERYLLLQTRLNERARSMFMQGPAAELEFFLGASSFGELADKLEYSSAIAGDDADLATEVENLKNQLDAKAGALRTLEAQQVAALSDLQTQLDDLQAKFDQQQNAYDAIAAKRLEAERLVAGLKKKYQQELQQSIPSVSGGGGTVGSNPFSVCPVGTPRAISDGFGAPRYGGGYHLHAGNDIMAPTGTPIYATFDGVASNASNTLGGLSVSVSGSQGYTYNAHMSRIGQLGSVQAGDVIGYVGATGDTSTPHDHFEWHPNAIPSSWPASPYGYSVIGDAVNPYPILVAVC